MTTHVPMVYVRERLSWEYKRLERREAPSVEELNALGAEGWELVAVCRVDAHVHFYFKRDISARGCARVTETGKP